MHPKLKPNESILSSFSRIDNLQKTVLFQSIRRGVKAIFQSWCGTYIRAVEWRRCYIAEIIQQWNMFSVQWYSDFWPRLISNGTLNEFINLMKWNNVSLCKCNFFGSKPQTCGCWMHLIENCGYWMRKETY